MSSTPDIAKPRLGAPVESQYLSEKGQQIRDEVRGFVPMLRSQGAAAEQDGALTEEMLAALDGAGVFKINLPLDLGGYALGARDTVEIITELGRGDGSAGWLAFVAGGIRNLLAFPPEAVEEVLGDVDGWLGPVAVGASVFSTAVGAARLVDGGWMVEGKWSFGSGSRHAKWAVVGVEFDHPPGSGRGMAILSRDQYEVLDDWKVMGLSGTSSNSVRTEQEVFVPAHRLLDLAEFPKLMDEIRGRYQGIAFRNGAAALMLTTCLSNIAIALGMARGAFECFVEQAQARKPFNLPYPNVAEMASTQVTAAKARAMINVAEALIHRHADEVDRRALLDEDFSPLEESEMTMDLVYATRMCAEAIDMMQIALGSSTVALKNPIQRYVRDVRVLITHGAIRLDPLAEINGRHIFGLEPFPMFAGGVPQVS